MPAFEPEEGPPGKGKQKVEDKTPFKCDEPNCTRKEGFGTADDLERHRESCHNKESGNGPRVVYRCFAFECGKRFRRWKYLDDFGHHLAEMHPNENPSELLKKSEEWFAKEEARAKVRLWGSSLHPPLAQDSQVGITEEASKRSRDLTLIGTGSAPSPPLNSKVFTPNILSSSQSFINTENVPQMEITEEVLKSLHIISRESYLAALCVRKPEAIVSTGPLKGIIDTYYGRIADTFDAVILIEACRRGLVERVTRFRFHWLSRAVRPGSVLVFCEDEMGAHSTQNVRPKGDKMAILQCIASRSLNQLTKRWWLVTDPDNYTWTIVAHPHPHEQTHELKRPLNDQRFSHIHSMLAPTKSLTDTPELSGTNKESKLDEGQSLSKCTVSELLKTDADLTVKSETESVYSDDYATSDTRMEYLSEFADELVKVIQPYQPDEKTVQRISAVLLDLLKAFALSLGHGSPTPLHSDMMVLIHKNRKYIVTVFKERLIRDNSNKERPEYGNDMPSGDIMCLRQSKNDDHAHKQVQHTERQLEAEAHGHESLRLLEYRRLVQGAPTYTWLLSHVRNECILYTPGQDVAKGIRNAILKSLPVSSRISHQKPTETFSVGFKIKWDPLKFLLEEYEEDPAAALEQALTFTGFDSEVEAESFGEYMRRTWPVTGDAMVLLLKSLVSNTREGFVTRDDDITMNISMHPSQDCKSSLVVWLDICGTAASIAEVGEQLAWAASALQSAQHEHTLVRSKPIINSVQIGHVSNQDSPSISYVFDIGIELHEINPSAEYCWLGLVSRPAVVEGFPIRQRPAECPPGLEIPLHVMAHLMDTRKVHRFHGKTVLKGFSTLLVPTGSINDTISWHLIQQSNDQRISYLESQIFPDLTISISQLEKARHILGWCPEMVFYGGAADANYGISDSQLPRLPPRCELRILKDASLSSDYTITGTKGYILGRKDVRLRRNGYVSKMKWVAEKYINVWDVGEERGWLLNGASGLLHLVRASLERDRSDSALRSVLLLKEGSLTEASKAHHPAAALHILLNPKNVDLSIYCVDAHVKFKDRVEDFYDQLEKMYDYQVSGLRDIEGMAAVPRSLLEGWDFQDLIHERDPIHPRHTTLNQDGLSWVDFIRSIKAITLFGRDFGNIVRPLNSSCPKWSILKPKKSYLAATMFDLNKIMAAHGDPYSVPMKLTHDIIWNIPEETLALCPCNGDRHKSHTILVQSLLPSSMRRQLLAISSIPSNMGRNDGAVIFGFNKRHRWFWSDTGPPSRTPIHLGSDTPYKESLNTHSDDSGLGGSSYSSTPSETGMPASSSSSANDNPNSSQRLRILPGSGKRQIGIGSNSQSANKYRIGIVCALHIELKAVRSLFDEAHSNVAIADGDPNYYAFGRMGGHNVVAVCLPHGVYGTNAATDVISNMRRSFPSLDFCLLAGIGAGVPSTKNDIRLGDVVVSTPSGMYSGVLPYDMIKSLELGISRLNGYLCPPPQTLMCAISELESDPNLSPTPLDELLQRIQERSPQYKYPGADNDQLFTPEYIHPNEKDETCERCDPSYLMRRTRRSSDQPRIFYGLIASGNRLMRSASERDKLGREHNVLCFEMEAAGVMNTFPCLIIRGICDYADSHKNKTWQYYASATAAAYAKLLLSRVRGSGTTESLASTAEVLQDQYSSRKRLRSQETGGYRMSRKRQHNQMAAAQSCWDGDEGRPERSDENDGSSVHYESLSSSE
ncbi:hypothetical protein DTO021C3_6212 [Paecilomyces variotii]|nr:hypothetical protein DTO021C3_6212 [Paecilomyces variotii]